MRGRKRRGGGRRGEEEGEGKGQVRKGEKRQANREEEEEAGCVGVKVPLLYQDARGKNRWRVSFVGLGEDMCPLESRA